MLQPALLLGTAVRQALLWGVAAAVGSALFRALLAVQYESLTYVRLLGVRLATRRRCGLWSSSRFLPLRQLQGIIIHEAVTPASVHFYIGLPLKEEAQPGSTGSGGGGSKRAPSSRRLSGGGGRRLAGDDGGVVEVVFPSLRPRLALLRQVYQQLQPLLQADLEAVKGEVDAAAPPPTPLNH
jgi:hypothetical protein